MRKAVTFLQSVARFRSNLTITAIDVHEITGVCHQKKKRRDENSFGFVGHSGDCY